MKLLLIVLGMMVAAASAQEPAGIVCNCPTQCAAMWAQAAPSAELATGMRVRIATDSLIETYGGVSPLYLSAIVTKTPIDANAARIVIRVDSRYGATQGAADEGEHIFYIDLASAGKSVACPIPK